MKNKQVRAMLSSVNPYIGYAIELKVRAKSLKIAAVPTKDVPGYLEMKWDVLTMREFFILSMAGRKDIKWSNYFNENNFILLLDTKSLPKRPMPFNSILFNKAVFENKIASHKKFWGYRDKYRPTKNGSGKIRTASLGSESFAPKLLTKYTETDVFVSIRNTPSTGESTLTANRGKLRGSDPLWAGSERQPFLPITPGLLKRRFLKKKDNDAGSSDDFNPASDENYALRAD